jgi:hypothetical protein
MAAFRIIIDFTPETRDPARVSGSWYVYCLFLSGMEEGRDLLHLINIIRG